MFTFGDNDLELMALGVADYAHHSGDEYDREFAGHYSLVNVGGKLKFKYVKIIAVWLITYDQQLPFGRVRSLHAEPDSLADCGRLDLKPM